MARIGLAAIAIGAALSRAALASAPMEPVAFGHEFRQDDCPSIAVAPDGSIWTAWLSYSGSSDTVAIRRYSGGKWGNLLWVPGSEGDNWLPQVATDPSNGVWVVWSAQVDGNWDIYARRFDPLRQYWGPLERLSRDPQPDINPRLWSDGKGNAALVWQGFRAGGSDIFLRTLEGGKWLPEVRVTRGPGNEWEPAVALDRYGTAWVVYDSYRNGNYDVFLSRVREGGVQGGELPVANTARFEARATVAVDSSDRVWVAWEEGLPNWGKDQGYIIRNRQTGAFLGGFREMQIRCYTGRQWREPAAPLPSEMRGGYTHHPHVYAGPGDSVWVAAKLRRTATGTPPPTPKARDGYQPLGERGFWEYWLTRYDGVAWAEAFPLPSSRGRISTRPHGAFDAQGNLWLAWPTDNRTPDNPFRPIRGQVYAGRFSAPTKPWTDQSMQSVRPRPVPSGIQTAHPNEKADVAAIRQYRTSLNGKPHRIVRGDFHRHTELSWDIGGTSDGSLQDFYRYMIDAASMDFGSSTDHQGGAWPYWWWYSQKMTDMYHMPGVYVPVFGYERSAQYPFGHRNIFFLKRSDARVTPFFVKEGTPGYTLPAGRPGDEPPVGTPSLVENDTLLLFAEMRRYNAIAISHTSGTNMGTDWRYYDPELDPAAEILQGCRTSYEQEGAPHVARLPQDAEHIKLVGYRPEGMLAKAWAKGYSLGVVASSDHFSTHISYAMVYAGELSRQGVLDAIRKRHIYGATDNIILETRMGEHFMGDEFKLSKPLPLRIKARGTRPIARIDIIRDGAVIYSASPMREDLELAYTDAAAPNSGRHHYYVRLVQDDEMIAWSSPMFVNY